MNEWKGLLKSKTVWGVICMIVGSFLGWGAEVQAEVADNVMLIVSGAFDIFGAGLAIYGRVKAKAEIKGVL